MLQLHWVILEAMCQARSLVKHTFQLLRQIISLINFVIFVVLLFSLRFHFDNLLQVLDETGCGDTFLTCCVLELLLHKRSLIMSPGSGRATGGIPFMQ